MQFVSSNIYYLEVNFLKKSNVKVKRFSSNSLALISKVKVFKTWVKVTVSKIMVITERSYHKEYSCEVSKL